MARYVWMAVIALAVVALAGCSSGSWDIKGTMGVTPQSLSHTGGAITCTAALTYGPTPTAVAAQIDDGSVVTDVSLTAVDDQNYQVSYILPGNYGTTAKVYTVTVVATDDDGDDTTLGQETVTVAAPSAPPGDDPEFP
jgi:hypothetical protein